MDARHGQVVGQGAVAVDLDAVVVRRRGARVMVMSWMSRISGKLRATSRSWLRALWLSRSSCGGLDDGGGLGFDVGEDGGDLGDFAAHVGFERGDDVVGLAERHGLVDFEMLLDVQCAVVLLDADVVDGEVGAAATARMRSKTLSRSEAVGTVWMTTSAPGRRAGRRRWRRR